MLKVHLGCCPFSKVCASDLAGVEELIWTIQRLMFIQSVKPVTFTRHLLAELIGSQWMGIYFFSCLCSAGLLIFPNGVCFYRQHLWCTVWLMCSLSEDDKWRVETNNSPGSACTERGKERTVILEGISNKVLITALMWGSLAFCFWRNLIFASLEAEEGKRASLTNRLEDSLQRARFPWARGAGCPQCTSNALGLMLKTSLHACSARGRFVVEDILHVLVWLIALNFNIPHYSSGLSSWCSCPAKVPHVPWQQTTPLAPGQVETASVDC